MNSYLLDIAPRGRKSERLDLGNNEGRAEEAFTLAQCEYAMDGYIVSCNGWKAIARTRDGSDFVVLMLLRREGEDHAALAMRDYEAMPVQYAGTGYIPGQVIFPTGDETTEIDEVQHG